MFRDSHFPMPNNNFDTSKSETKKEESAIKIENLETKKEQPDFMVENFKTAIFDHSLIGYALAQDKEAWLAEHQLSETEARLISGAKQPKINLMIDIDGVLIDTESEIKKLSQIMTTDFSIVKNAKEAALLIKQSKIPFEVLKVLLQARNQAEELHLVTDRMGYGPCHFPCLGKKKRQVLEDHGLNLKTNAFKMFSSGNEFAPMIEKSDITYYIGSSNSDRMYVDKIRKAMSDPDNQASKEKLKYLEIMPNENRNKNIL